MIATVWIDDAHLATNKAQGYVSTDCISRINRTVMFDNDGGGLASYGAGSTHIINSYISGNGTQNGGDFSGVRSAQGNELHLNLSGPPRCILHREFNAYSATLSSPIHAKNPAPRI